MEKITVGDGFMEGNKQGVQWERAALGLPPTASSDEMLAETRRVGAERYRSRLLETGSAYLDGWRVPEHARASFVLGKAHMQWAMAETLAVLTERAH